MEAYGLKNNVTFRFHDDSDLYWKTLWPKKEFAGGPKHLKRSTAYWKHILHEFGTVLAPISTSKQLVWENVEVSR